MKAASILLCAAALAAAGCGGSGDSAGPARPEDKQTAVLECLQAEGFDARSEGSTVELTELEGARVEFNVSSGESETKAFKGEAEGAEQLGSTLLFVGPANDDQLDVIEECVIG